MRKMYPENILKFFYRGWVRVSKWGWNGWECGCEIFYSGGEAGFDTGF